MKAHIVPLIIPDRNMISLNFLPSEMMIEILLLLFGLAVIVCSNYLRKAHVKLAGWQLIIGVIIAIISAALSLGLLTLKPGGIFGLNYTDILFGLGLILSVLGIIQLILRLTGDLQAVPEQKIIESRSLARGLRRRPIGQPSVLFWPNSRLTVMYFRIYFIVFNIKPG